ncbi:tetratricopeptide repeat protein [Leptospira sp. 96542]|nr:tetratricopeptide repeat protein [Leptospira sp. 96542]
MDLQTSLNFKLIQRALIFLIFPLTTVLWSEEVSFNNLFAEYKRGNYELVAKQSLGHLNSGVSEKDPRIFFLYISTEESWYLIKKMTERETTPHFKNSVHYWNSIYLCMDRAIVFGETDKIVEWGKQFQKSGKQSPKYPDALLLYSIALIDLKNLSEARRVVDELEKLSPNEDLKKQILEIKTTLN